MGTGDRRGGPDAGCGRAIVVIPDTWRHHKTGEDLEDRELASEQWAQLTDRMNELGRRILDEYGLAVQFHPTPTATSVTSRRSSGSSTPPIRSRSTSASTPGISPTTAATAWS